MTVGSNSNILFEMLRSFVTLARTLNLSQAVRELNSTRQTVRRHIDILEKARGEKLFELKDRHYQLTETGKRAIPEAEIILARGNAWLSGQLEMADNLQTITIDNHKSNPEEPILYSQQHKLNTIWQHGTPLLRHGIESWVNARAEIENEAFAAVRPYWIIFRRLGDKWFCVEIGEQSALASWFGWTWTKSAIGRIWEETPVGPELGDHILRDYDWVVNTGGARLDHQYRHVPREENGPAIAISFQRLLLACKFPDGSSGLVTLSDRTRQIDIPALDTSQLVKMDSDLIMEFDPGNP